MITTSQVTIQSTFVTNDSISDKTQASKSALYKQLSTSEKGEEELEMKGSEWWAMFDRLHNDVQAQSMYSSQIIPCQINASKEARVQYTNREKRNWRWRNLNDGRCSIVYTVTRAQQWPCQGGVMITVIIASDVFVATLSTPANKD